MDVGSRITVPYMRQSVVSHSVLVYLSCVVFCSFSLSLNL